MTARKKGGLGSAVGEARVGEDFLARIYPSDEPKAAHPASLSLKGDNDLKEKRVAKSFTLPPALVKRMKLFVIDNPDIRFENTLVEVALNAYLTERGF